MSGEYFVLLNVHMYASGGGKIQHLVSRCYTTGCMILLTNDGHGQAGTAKYLRVMEGHFCDVTLSWDQVLGVLRIGETGGREERERV